MPAGGALRQAFGTLASHRRRALLTLAGVVWGTASVVFLASWGEGVRVMIERGFFKAGKNMAEVWAGRVSAEFSPAVDRRWLWYRPEDVERLRRSARLVEVVGSQCDDWVPATAQGRALTIDLRGIDLGLQEIRGTALAAGRALQPSDLSHRRRVVVLGDTVRRRLLGGGRGVGATIRLDGKPFQVVGLLERVGTQLTRDRSEIDEQAWIPITTFRAHWPAWWTDEPIVNRIFYRLRDPAKIEETEHEVRGILARALRVPASDDEAIGIFSPTTMLNRLGPGRTRGILLVLSITTLVVSGLGVVTMMLDAVYERRQEIGVRLAVGARRRDVLVQFFLETFALTAGGGLLGVALGILLCLLLGGLQVPDMVPVPILQARAIVLALSVMTLVGVVASVVPAWRATRVDPAVVLRME
jgi:putative ABC transport system permease protein